MLNSTRVTMTDDEVTGLLIEDNPSDAFLLKELVADGRTRLKLLHAERLEDGLALLRSATFDIVLLDLSLPDARGIETVTRTYAARRDIPIIVLTGTDDEQLAMEAMHAGAQDYLVKGHVDRNLLTRAILYARERKRTEAANQRLVREQAARAGAEAAERSARFLADASRALSSSLDYDQTLSTLAALTVPVVADCCLIDLIDGNGQVRRVGALSLDGDEPEQWREDLGESPKGPNDPVAQALRTSDAVDLPVVSEATARTLRLPKKCSHLLTRTAVIAPMIARGRTLGTMTLIAWSPGRRHGHVSLLAMELAGRAALAVDNARLYRARELLLEVVSHDLRTPLTTILANLALIEDFKAPPKGPLETLGRAAQQMNHLVEDLLDMSRLERGTFALDRQPMDVTVLLDEVAQSLRSNADIRGLQLSVIASRDLPNVYADRRRLTQVLWNLVGNGFKFTPSGGKVELRAVAFEDELRVEVADNGPGIPDAQLPHLFERFWQGESGDNRGVGVGLSIAKAIVEAHDGKIGVISSGSGTTFFFTLPRTSAG
ncbi:MAG TPA: ATP-binding protein [Myxococcaceae bacterium]|nr:ATP-binding protein [Myxococcaceae bacterium]